MKKKIAASNANSKGSSRSVIESDLAYHSQYRDHWQPANFLD
ncbi:hypothetical protein [Dictyobacter formicarum]|nr:hypothetical protein [Dictyobacter formicarum]